MKTITSVRVDGCLCTGHKLCLPEAPEVFSFDPVRDVAFVMPDACLNFATSAQGIYAAAAVCPMDAIVINDREPERVT